MSSDEKNCEEQQSTLFSCSLCSNSCILMPVSKKHGNIKLLSSSEAGCCIKAITECTKLCQTCAKKFSSPKPASFSVELCECEDETPLSLTCASEDERTHKRKSCDTPGCIHNSQGVQPSYEDADPCPVSCTGACSSHSSVTSQSLVTSQSPVILQKPVYIDPRLKDHTPKSIEELKASITGLTGLEKSPVGNLHGCEFIEFNCGVHTFGSGCEPKDSQTSEPGCSDRPVRQGFSLTMEPNDHRFCTNPGDCKHTREPCPPEEPPCPPEEPPCPPEKPPCPTPPRPPCDSSDCEQCAFQRRQR